MERVAGRVGSEHRGVTAARPVAVAITDSVRLAVRVRLGLGPESQEGDSSSRTKEGFNADEKLFHEFRTG